MTELHDRVTRIIREEKEQRYASEDDRIDALAAAVITGLELTAKEWGYWFANTMDEPVPGNRREAFWQPLDGKPTDEIRALAKSYPNRDIGYRYVTEWIPDSEPVIPPNGLI